MTFLYQKSRCLIEAFSLHLKHLLLFLPTTMYEGSGNKTFIAILFSFVTLVINFIFSQKLAKVFGKSQLFGLGLFFFQPVFIMLLGYGDAEYYGQQ